MLCGVERSMSGLFLVIFLTWQTQYRQPWSWSVAARSVANAVFVFYIYIGYMSACTGVGKQLHTIPSHPTSWVNLRWQTLMKYIFSDLLTCNKTATSPLLQLHLTMQVTGQATATQHRKTILFTISAWSFWVSYTYTKNSNAAKTLNWAQSEGMAWGHLPPTCLARCSWFL